MDLEASMDTNLRERLHDGGSSHATLMRAGKHLIERVMELVRGIEIKYTKNPHEKEI